MTTSKTRTVDNPLLMDDIVVSALKKAYNGEDTTLTQGEKIALDTYLKNTQQLIQSTDDFLNKLKSDIESDSSQTKADI